MLRCVWRDYVQEVATEDDVLGVLDQVTGYILFELETLRQQALQGISDPENRTFQAIVGAFEQHLEANQTMAEEFSAENSKDFGEVFRRGFGLAQQATQSMMDAHRVTMEDIEAMSQLDCIFCGHSNLRGTGRCAKCGRNLPGGSQSSSFSLIEQEGLDPAAGPEVTQNYALLDQALDAWEVGDMEDEALGQLLDDIEQKLLGHQAETETQHSEIQRAPKHAQEALREGVSLTQEALKASLEALKSLKDGFQKGNAEQMGQGFEEFESASHSMVQAYKASREAGRLAKWPAT